MNPYRPHGVAQNIIIIHIIVYHLSILISFHAIDLLVLFLISKHHHSAWGYNCFACDFATAVQWAGPPYHDHWSGAEVVGLFFL